MRASVCWDRREYTLCMCFLERQNEDKMPTFKMWTLKGVWTGCGHRDGQYVVEKNLPTGNKNYVFRQESPHL